MKIKVAEQFVEVPDGVTLFRLRDSVKPGADVIVHNGAPVADDGPVQDGDEIVFIRRGEMPPQDELEALMMARHTPGVHEAVRRATVGIAGLGGLGSAVAVALARIGTGRLILADFDVVEPSNLNRQQYFVDQLGMLKTEALAANLKRIAPFVTLELHGVRLTPQNVPEVFAEAQVLVEAFDKAEEKAMLLDAWCAAFPDRPIVMASGLAGYGSSNAVRTRRLAKNIILIGDLETAARPGTGLMAPRVGIAAHHQANAVLQFLLGCDITAETQGT